MYCFLYLSIIQALFACVGCSPLLGIIYLLCTSQPYIMTSIIVLLVICVSFNVFICSWRVFAIKRRNEEGVRTQVNPWLVSWFTLSLLAPVFWLWLYKCNCTSNNKSNTSKLVCPWRQADTYMFIVLGLAIASNLLWLIHLCFVNPKKVSIIPHNG
jgi:hypothetical protein